MAEKNSLTAAYVRSILDYDPETGALTWKDRPPSMFRPGRWSREHSCACWNSRYAGRIAGCLSGKGYLITKVNGKIYSAHRLAWLWMTGQWPKEEIDHRDGDRSNNRFANLREATSAENKCNAKRRTDNSSGVKGVYWNSQASKWLVQIRVNGKQRSIGYFEEDKLDDAASAYDRAAREHHGDFARTE